MPVILLLAESSIQLVPDGTLIVHLLVIVLMVMLLSRSLFKPISRILEERHSRGEGLSQEARQMIAEMEAKLNQYEQSLRAARTEGYRLLESQKAEAVREREAQLAVARDQLQRTIGIERERIGKEAETARSELGNKATQIAREITSRILGRQVGR